MTLEQFEVFQIFATDFKRNLRQFKSSAKDLYVEEMFDDLIMQVDKYVEVIGEAVPGSTYDQG